MSGEPAKPGRTDFSRRLLENLDDLHRLLGDPSFGVGPMSFGAELEVSLVGLDGRSSPINAKVLEEGLDSRIGVELDRFNLEFNSSPMPFKGALFAGLGDQLTHAIESMTNAAAMHDARIISVGILPTLDLEDLQSSAMTDHARYHALSQALRKLSNDVFRIEVDGPDPLSAQCNDVTLEGAATSFQLHLRVAPDQFADLYNAAQLATPVALAVAGNSPMFLGHRLWEETRVVLFKQAVDGRERSRVRSFPPPRVWFGNGWVRDGAYELFAEIVALYAPLLPDLEGVYSGSDSMPALEELRLHNSTVWRWNRPVYDPGDGGHLRIEFRALPSGPSVADMVANAAFLVGLTLGLRPKMRELLPAIPFELVRYSFYRAAQHGLEAEVFWPDAPPSPRPHRAADLALSLVDPAEDGLIEGGIDPVDAQNALAVIRERIESGQTGARWQARAFESLRENHEAKRARCIMVERYIDGLRSGLPVHQWPLP